MIHDEMERSCVRFAEVQLRWRTTRKLGNAKLRF